MQYTEFNISSLLSYLLPKGLPFFATLQDNSNPIASDFDKADAEDYSYSFNESASSNIALVSQLNNSEFYRNNVLGRPVFLPASLSWFEAGRLQTYELPNPIVFISGRKNIITTQLAGKNAQGTVKEIISTNDYSINILCQSISNDRTWPLSDYNYLANIFKKNRQYTLRCILTDPFLQKENNVVITDISVPDMRGITNAQVVQFSLLSDKYYELEISE